ncbi:MAG TPA: MarR family transcriptional regulator [Conexibacter sp.]|nr:MarR family transcriptional regulator [Conexibacter sp.]
MFEPVSIDPIEEAGRQWRRRWGTDSVPPLAAVASIVRIHEILVARINDALAPFELTMARYEALMLLFLSRRGRLSLAKLAARLQAHPTSAADLAEALEQRGYATRAPDRHDPRTTLVTITERGRRTAAEATAVLNKQQFGTAPLRAQELVALTEILRRMRAGAGDAAA